jgi:hypothetical protein
MTTLRQILATCTLVGLLTISSLAQGPQGKGSGNGNQEQQQDGTCDQPSNGSGNLDCRQDGTGDKPAVDCDGAGPLQMGNGQGNRRGNGRGRGGQMPWRRSQQDRLNRQALAMGLLTEAETDHVLYMRQEEKLARDVYITLDERWLSAVFENIAVSEQRHMDAIGRIITAQELADPITDDALGVYAETAEGEEDVFGELYISLTETGMISYAEALKVGAYIEELDILDLLAALEDVENEYAVRVFQNLLRGSRNHLRAFVNALEGEGETYTPQLMTQEQYDAIVSGPVERAIGKGNSNNQQSQNDNK